jgi:hypothetical protein
VTYLELYRKVGKEYEWISELRLGHVITDPLCNSCELNNFFDDFAKEFFVT